MDGQGCASAIIFTCEFYFYRLETVILMFRKVLALGSYPCGWSIFGRKLMFLNSYGTAKSGVGISAMSVLRPDLMMKCVIPVIMAGIIAVRIFAPGWCPDASSPTHYRFTASSSPS